MKKKICGNCFSPMSGKICRKCGCPDDRTRSEYDALPVGTELHGRYIIGRVLGMGGFGIIYLSYDRLNDRAVALKEYFPDGTASRSQDGLTVAPMTSQHTEAYSDGLKRFWAEAEIISRFRESAEIIGIFDVFKANGTAYYAMEFVRGASLKDYSERHTITSGQAVYIALKLLPALMILHREHILHRDVSPDNIMLCADGSVKLIDFGSAREIEERSQSISIILKQGFAPLEQYQRRGKQGGWTDIYSLGASLLFAMTGSTPDDPLTRMEDDSLFEKELNRLPPVLSKIISKACSLKPESRYQNAGEMLSAVEECGIDSDGFPEEEIQALITGRADNTTAIRPKRSFLSPAIAAVNSAAGSVTAFFSGIYTSLFPPEVKIGNEMYPVDSVELSLSDRELTNSKVSNLRHMKRLKVLDLTYNYLTDLSCLEGLTQLEQIHISHNNISDISFMKNMNELRQISAENTFVSDISVLRGKTKLESVFFGDSYVTDITPLKDSRRLRFVGFNEAKIPDINALEGMTELETLCFAGCGLTSIQPLKYSKKLKYVYFGRNDLSDLSPLVGCDISELYLDRNRLDGNTEAFRGLTVHGFIVINGNGYTEQDAETIRGTMSGEIEIVI